MFSGGFLRKFQSTFSTEQQQTATSELKKGRCKYWSSIVLFELRIISENTKFKKKQQKYSFRRKRKKIILFGRSQEEFSNNKIRLGKVIQRNITEEFTFVNRTAD